MVIMDLMDVDLTSSTSSSANAKRTEKRKASPSKGNVPVAGKAQKLTDGTRAPNISTIGSPARIIESIIPHKSPFDPNEYKVIKLSNGLTVALISRKDPASPLYPLASRSSVQHLHQSLTPQLQCRYIPEDLFSQMQQPECQYTILPLLGCSGNPQGPDLESEGNAINYKGQDQTEWTSVAMVVNVGGINDPEDTQGLAHFTEHMVHYGSFSYPGEGQVNEILTNFGTYNATTRQLTTSYYNEVPDLILDRNLGLFSEMLARPTFPLEVLKREVHSVDNEFDLRHLGWRRPLLQTHVGIQNRSHPLARFLCGSLETLGNGTELGSKKVQQRMEENHKKNYVASAMTLSINSSKSMAELEQLTIKYFSNILQGDRQVRHKMNLEDSRAEPINLRKGIHIYHQGLTSRAELTFLWHLPASIWLENGNEKTMHLIKELLSNTAPGSLDAHLRTNGLIWASFVFHNCTPYATILELSFLLTQKGQEDTRPVKDAIFQYISILESTGEREISKFFQQIRIAQLRDFHYGSQQSTLDNTKDCAMRLQYVERSEEVINFDSWQTAKFNYKRIKETFQLLQKEEELIVIETLPRQINLEEKLVEANNNRATKLEIKSAPYTGARYFVLPAGECTSQTSSSSASLQASETFCMPYVNSFLKEDLDRNKDSFGSGSGDHGHLQPIPPRNCGEIPPQRLRYRSRIDLPNNQGIAKVSGVHYGHSNSSHSPYLCGVRINFVSPSTRTSSPRGLALSWLWVVAIKQKLTTFQKEFALGGFIVNVSTQSGVLSVNVEGFPKHFEQVVTKIISKILKEPIPEMIFNLAKQELSVCWEFYLEEYHVISRALTSKLLFAQSDMAVDYLGILPELTLVDLNLYIRSFRKSTFSTIELFDNLPLQTFHNIATLLDEMEFGPFLDNNPMAYTLQYLIPLPHIYTPGETCVRVKNEASTSFTNSVTNLYILGRYCGNGHLPSEYFNLAMSFINHQAFMYLRTKKQLGYVVYAFKQSQRRMSAPLMMFSVHITASADKHSPCELDNKMDEFLSTFGDYLKTMPDHLFEKMKELKNISNDIRKEDVGKWFNSKFGPGFNQVNEPMKFFLRGIRKMSIQVLTAGNPESKQVTCSCRTCSGIKGWKKGRNYGSTLSYAEGDQEFGKYYLQF